MRRFTSVVVIIATIFIYGCTHTQKKQTGHQKEKIIPSESTLAEIKINYSKSQKDDGISINQLHRFMVQNDSSIINDFRNFWGDNEQYLGYNIQIEDSTIFLIDNKKVRSLKLIVRGDGEDFTADANNVYLIDITNPDTTIIMYQTGFFQPECGTSDFNFKSVGRFKLDKEDYYVIEKQDTIMGCCGAPYEDKTHLMIFKTNSFKAAIGDIITYHKNYNDDDCADKKPAITLESKIYYNNKELVLVSKIKTENRNEVIQDTTFFSIGDSIKQEKSVAEAKPDTVVTENKMVKNEVVGFDTLKIFPSDTLIGNEDYEITQISQSDFNKLKAQRIETEFAQDNPDEYLQKIDSCYIITLLSNETDTLRDFDDGEYYEKYQLHGFSKKTNTLMFDWENWEEAHSILINLNERKIWILNPEIAVSPDKTKLISYSNFVDYPLYESNEFFIYELTEDSVKTNYTFSNPNYGVFDSYWIGLNDVVIHLRRIEVGKYEAEESYYYEMKMKSAL